MEVSPLMNLTTWKYCYYFTGWIQDEKADHLESTTFENNKQNLSIHLELVILENSWHILTNNKQKIDYFVK